jgi:hypothetical protein
MTNLFEVKILVIDYGNNIGFAMRLSRDYGTVFYWAGPYVTDSFPTHNVADIANNVPNLIKVKEWAEVYDEVDEVAFCDSMEPALQSLMRRQGKPVFGCGYADCLEHDRLYIKQTLKDLGLPVGTYYVANGLDQLEQILTGARNVYVKSQLRGNGETWKHNSWRTTKRPFLKLKNDMGLYGNRETYVVEEMLKAIAEVGMDGWIVGGMWLPICMAGVERKDAAYLGKVIRYEWLPSQIKEITDKLAPIFHDMGYNGHHSNEVIITPDKRGFALDLTNRIPSPPGDLMQEIFTNYSEIIHYIANGRMPSVQYEHEWGAQVIIKSDIAAEDESPIVVPEEYQKNVKIKNLSIDEEGTWYYVPAPRLGMKEIGSIVVVGDSPDDVIKQAKIISESIEGFDIRMDVDALNDAKKAIEKVKKAGIDFI